MKQSTPHDDEFMDEFIREHPELVLTVNPIGSLLHNRLYGTPLRSVPELDFAEEDN